MLKLSIKFELTNGNYGRQKNWYRPAKARKQIEAILRAEGFVALNPFRDRVDLVITRHLGKGQRLWDSDSCGRGNAKELIDAIVACGWLHDDGPKWVRHCDYRQCDKDRPNGPYVTVEFKEITDT